MVHSVFLSRGGREYLRSHIATCLSGAETSWFYWLDGHALSDRNRALHENSP